MGDRLNISSAWPDRHPESKPHTATLMVWHCASSIFCIVTWWKGSTVISFMLCFSAHLEISIKRGTLGMTYLSTLLVKAAPLFASSNM